MSRTVVAVVLALFVSVCSFAEMKMPENDFYEGWIKKDIQLQFTKANLYGHINGGAELFLEYGFDELFVQRYELAGNEIGIEIYRMSSPESALGIYLAKAGRGEGMPGVSCRNVGNRYQITALKGDVFLIVYNYSGLDAVTPVIAAACNKVLKTIEPARPEPLFDRLPAGYQEGSEQIVRGQFALQPIYTLGDGDILQLDGEVFGVIADYSDKHDEYSVLVVDYLGEERATAAFENVIANLDPYLNVEKKTSKLLIFSDFMGEFGKIERDEKRLTVTLHLNEMPN